MAECVQVVEVLEKEITESAWFGLAFLVDGFPRTAAQARTFEQRVRPCDLVLYFECPEKVMLERLTIRGKTSGRSDDNAKTIKERLKSFKKLTLPVVELFQQEGKLHRYLTPAISNMIPHSCASFMLMPTDSSSIHIRVASPPHNQHPYSNV